MNFGKIISVIKAWENKVSEKYPLKIILAVCVIVILWQLYTIRLEMSKTQSDLSWLRNILNSLSGESTLSGKAR